MIDDTTVHGFVQPLLPCALIWAQQNAPRPAKPYAAMRWTASQSWTGAWITGVDENGVLAAQSACRDTLEIQIFGPSAMSLLDGLRMALRCPTASDAAVASGLAVLARGPVIDISALLDTAWEERAAMEIVLGHVAHATDTVGLIETVRAAGTLPGGGAAASLSLNIEMETPHG